MFGAITSGASASDPRFSAQLDELAQTLAATVAEEQGILARHLSQPAHAVGSDRSSEPTRRSALLPPRDDEVGQVPTVKPSPPYSMPSMSSRETAWHGRFLHAYTPPITRWS